jgi:putative tryptophan/tyrosine transport system substrate-binding protein
MKSTTVGLIVILTFSCLVGPLAVEAQPTKAPRVGYLSDESGSLGSASFEPIAQGLRELGYLEGRNIVFENRYADGKPEVLPGLAAELVRLKVDVIVAVGTPATRAAKNATETIPIVFTRIADPVTLGLVASLARPSGNLTGVSVLTLDLAAKWLELLTEAMPGVRRVGVFWDPTFPPAALQLREIERAARLLNVELQPVEVRAAEEFEAAGRAVVGQRTQALIVVPALLFTEQRHRLAELAVQHRLPTMWYRREQVEAGGLMSYGTNFSAMYRRAATYVDKILKGAKPADLPVEQPMKLELVINLKTAKALDLTIPPTLLFQADEVIQ